MADTVLMHRKIKGYEHMPAGYGGPDCCDNCRERDSEVPEICERCSYSDNYDLREPTKWPCLYEQERLRRVQYKGWVPKEDNVDWE